MISSDNTNQFYCGYLPQKYIFDLANLPELFAGCSMLITCIDSTPTPFDKGWEYARKMHWKIETLQNGYWVDQADVHRILADKNTFVPYSEIYCFSHNRKPASENKLAIHTSDWCYFNQSVPEVFMKSLRSLHADIYLSDGSGLNYACTSKERGLLLEQSLKI